LSTEGKPKPSKDIDPADEFFDDDDRPIWEKSDPAAGLSTWDALFHFVDRERAERLYELDLGGYGDPSVIDPLWWPEEQEEFNAGARELRRLQTDLESRLVRMLASGELIAKGFSNQTPLDGDRRHVNRERWLDLDLDLKESIATGPGIAITQILIFAASGPKADEPAKPAAFSAAALRRWYLDRIAACDAEGRQPSREDDYRDANAAFGRVPKRQVEAIRRELAPEAWTKKGRRKTL
jgi:hypothetical protein